LYSIEVDTNGRIDFKDFLAFAALFSDVN